MTFGTRAVLVSCLLMFRADVVQPRATVESQVSADRTARIAGTVVDSAGRPVRQAIAVAFSANVPEGRIVVTDDVGRFVLDRLPPGAFTVTIRKAAYLATNYGALGFGDPGQFVPLAAGQHADGLHVVLLKGGVVSGTIRDANGGPVEGVKVEVRRLGRPFRSNSLDAPESNSGVTDDRGEYRVFGLPPGDYLAFAHPEFPEQPEAETYGGASHVKEWTTYYPGTIDEATATPVAVEAERERAGTDFRLAPLPVFSISGQVTGAPGASVAQLYLSTTNNVPAMFHAEAVIRNGTGQFSFHGAPAGRYVLSMSYSVTGANPTVMWGSTSVDVNAEVDGLVVESHPGVTVSGRVEAQDPPSPGRPVVMWLVPAVNPNSSWLAAPQMVARTSTRPDGTFTFEGVVPGRYWITGRYWASNTSDGANASGATPFWPPSQLRAASVGDGSDLLDVPLDVTSDKSVANLNLVVSSQGASISGTVRSVGGWPVWPRPLFLFPVDPRLRTVPTRLRSGGAQYGSGAYEIAQVRPGEYFIAMFDGFLKNDAADPALLNDLARSAVRVRIGDNERKVLDLSVP